MSFFASPVLPQTLRTACSKYIVCFMSWHQEFWLFYTHPIHLGLFMIASSVKRRNGSLCPVCWRRGVIWFTQRKSRTIHLRWSILPHQMRAAQWHQWSAPLDTPEGFLLSFFPPKRYVSDKQKTEGTSLGFCCVKQNKETCLVVDQQLLVYIVEEVQRSSRLGEAFRNSPEVFALKRLQCWWRGKARGMGKERLAIHFMKCLIAQLVSLQFPSLRNGRHLYISIISQAALFHDKYKTRHPRNPEPFSSTC